MEGIDYPGLAIIAAVAVLVSAAGTVVDKFLLPKEKDRLSESLTAWWVRISDLHLPDVPAKFATSFVALERKIFGARLVSVRWLLTTCVVSIVFTGSCLYAGDYLFFEDLSDATRYFAGKPRIPTFFLNYLFDFSTIAITVILMAAFVNASGWLRFVIVVGDIVLATLFAFAVYEFSLSIEHWDSPEVSIGAAGFSATYFTQDVQSFFSFWEMAGLFSWDSPVIQELSAFSGEWFGPHHNVGHRQWREGNTSSFLTSTTTLLPTVMWSFGLMLLLCSMATYRLVRFVVLRVLQLDIETDKSIYLYTGVLVGFMGLLVKTLLEVGKVL